MPERRRGEYAISTDPSRLDLGAVHAFLRDSYWAKGVPREVVERSVANSLCFGLYRGGEQVGFARVTSDRATFAYLYSTMPKCCSSDRLVVARSIPMP